MGCGDDGLNLGFLKNAEARFGFGNDGGFAEDCYGFYGKWLWLLRKIVMIFCGK